MVPVHASIGLATFMLAIASCISGLTQKAIWTLGLVRFMLIIAIKFIFLNCFNEIFIFFHFILLNSDQYSKFSEEGIIVNALGCVLIALGVLVSFAVRRSNAPATAKVYVTERI